MLVSLAGRDVTELDRIVTRQLDETTAIALSRGRFAKGYDAVDPNEDAVLAASGPRGRLLAVLDGHNGIEASHAVLDSLTSEAEEALAAPPELQPPQLLATLVRHATAAIATATTNAEPPRDRSRTALVLTLVESDGTLTWCSYGDGALVRVRGRRARGLNAPSRFLGPSSPPPRVAEIDTKPGDRLVLATDGLADHLGRSWKRRITKASAKGPEETAGALIKEAHVGGAGDNVAVVVSDATSARG